MHLYKHPPIASVLSIISHVRRMCTVLFLIQIDTRTAANHRRGCGWQIFDMIYRNGMKSTHKIRFLDLPNR